MSLKISGGSSPESTTQVSNPKVVEAKDKETMKRLFLEITTPIRNVEMSNNERDRRKIVLLSRQEKEAQAAEIEKWKKKPVQETEFWD